MKRNSLPHRVEAWLGIIAAAAKLLVGFGLAVGAKGVLRIMQRYAVRAKPRGQRRPKGVRYARHCFGSLAALAAAHRGR